MGIEIHQEQFDPEDHRRFAERLRECLQALAEVLARPGFGEGPTTTGAEVELNLVDVDAAPLAKNDDIALTANDRRVTLELDRFNLEINSPKFDLSGRPFERLGAELDDALAVVRKAAAAHGGSVAMIGILPTLGAHHLLPEMMTDGRRYGALSAALREARGEPFRFQIAGRDTLSLQADDVTVEGANTSFQVHLRVGAKDFARTYNAAQVAVGFVLAAGGNSPTFLGRHLWEETRIALCQQAIDPRTPDEYDFRPARVSFGQGWVRSGVHELFAESVLQHAPLLPVLSDEEPLHRLREGGIPLLDELKLHNGTVWRWNRPIYDASQGGHLRIEMRALPAGPTVVDMMANAAFLVGLTMGLADNIEEVLAGLTFSQAKRNFYQAARFGLQAELLYPSVLAPSPRAFRIQELIPTLLPIAMRGLVACEVEHDEASRCLQIIEDRVASGQTGSVWQRKVLDASSSGNSGASTSLFENNASAMLQRYIELSERGEPVHHWPA